VNAGSSGTEECGLCGTAQMLRAAVLRVQRVRARRSSHPGTLLATGGPLLSGRGSTGCFTSCASAARFTSSGLPTRRERHRERQPAAVVATPGAAAALTSGTRLPRVEVTSRPALATTLQQDKDAEMTGHGTSGATHKYPAGTELCRQGNAATHVYLITQGVVKIVLTERNGREAIIGLRFPEWYIGAPCVIAGAVHPMSAVTCTTAEAVQYSANDFLTRLRRDSDFSWQIHQLHARATFEFVERISQFAVLSARERLLRVLRTTAAAFAPEHPHNARPSEFLCATRTSLGLSVLLRNT